jgi:hypothetical protein
LIGLFSRATVLLVALFIGFCGLGVGEASWARMSFRIAVICCGLLLWDILLGHNDLTVLRKRLDGRGMGPGALGLVGSTVLAAAAMVFALVTSPTAWNSIGSTNAYSLLLFPSLFFVPWLSLIALAQGRAIRASARRDAAVGLRVHARSRSSVLLALCVWAGWLYWTWALVFVHALGLLGVEALRDAIERSNDLPPQTVSLLVKLGPDDRISELEPSLRTVHGGAELVSFRDPRWIRVTVPAEELHTAALLLRLDPENVDLVEGSARALSEPTGDEGPCPRTSDSSSNDPMGSRQPAFVLSGGAAASRALRRVRGPERPAVLAILDHPIVAHRDLPLREGARFADAHGQQVAAAAAAIADNGYGLTSLNHRGAKVQILNLPVLGADHFTDAGHVAVAIDSARERGADVINLSLGANGSAPTVLVEAIERALSERIIVVAAAGNDGPFADAADQWPANIPGVLVVAGHDPGGRRSALSNTTKRVSRAVSAPGDTVCVPVDGDYAAKSGTSFATAQVSGALAAFRSHCPGIGPDQAWALLVETGHPEPTGSIGPRVRLDAAWERALTANLCDVRPRPATFDELGEELLRQYLTPRPRPRYDTGH